MAQQPVKIFQGYLWYPKTLAFDIQQHLPPVLEDVHLLCDEISPPFAFFDNGELASTQHFFQFTALKIYTQKPSDEAMHHDAKTLENALNIILMETPPEVGWQLMEDLRAVE